MEVGPLVTAGLFLLIGLVTAVNPLFAFNLRAWFSREVMQMKVEPGGRTLAIYRVVGIAFAVIGAVMLFSGLT